MKSPDVVWVTPTRHHARPAGVIILACLSMEEPGAALADQAGELEDRPRVSSTRSRACLGRPAKQVTSRMGLEVKKITSTGEGFAGGELEAPLPA